MLKYSNKVPITKPTGNIELHKSTVLRVPQIAQDCLIKYLRRCSKNSNNILLNSKYRGKL